MFKTKTRKSVIRPLNLTNPYYTAGPRTKLRVIKSALPTGVFSVEARDNALDAKRNRERMRTGALSGKQLMLRVLHENEAKKKFLSQIQKLVRNQALTEEVAQRINALSEADRQWVSNKQKLVANLDEIRQAVRQVDPNATEGRIRAAAALAENYGVNTLVSLNKKKRRGPIGFGMIEGIVDPNLLRVPRIFELTQPEARVEKRPVETNVKVEQGKEELRRAQQAAYQKYLTLLHGQEPPSDMVKEAYPKTAEPLVAVSTPKPNPTMQVNRLHTHTPFVVGHW
jgi:hypothetical protein